MMDDSKTSLVDDVFNVLRGLLMGAADVIPGVSGGTVALIVGIYQRLVTAVSRFDLNFVSLLRQRKVLGAMQHVDMRFLTALGLGILTGIVALGGVMNELLTGASTRGPTLAAFFGMILASTVLVGRQIKVKHEWQILVAIFLAFVGAAFAWWLTSLPAAHAAESSPSTVQDPGLMFLLACGMIAICAMILPGISGAYILLILGTYAHLTGILKALPKGQVDGHDLLDVAVFAAGCGIGLLAFSKFLRWLLTHYHWHTMAVLCGFMIGALRRIWPFQLDKTPDVHELKYKVFVNIWPKALDQGVVIVVVVGLLAMAAVFALDWMSRRKKGGAISSRAPKGGPSGAE
jgi:putative membrane protein